MDTITCKNNLGKLVTLPRQKFFFRPSVYGLIVSQGKVVTLRNKSNGKIWFPGGGVEVGEILEQALEREVQEETGLQIRINRLLFFKENFFYYQPLDEAYHAFLFFYLCEPLTKKLIADEHVQDYESKRPRWTEISDINKEEINDLATELYTALAGLV